MLKCNLLLPAVRCPGSGVEVGVAVVRGRGGGRREGQTEMLQYASTSLTSSSTSLQYSPPSTLQVPAPPAAPLPRRETCVRDCCRFITLSCPRPAPGKPPPGLTSASSSPAGVGRRAVQRTVRPAHMPCGLEPDSDEATLCGEASNPPQHQQTRYQGRMKMNINRTIYICHLAWH